MLEQNEAPAPKLPLGLALLPIFSSGFAVSIGIFVLIGWIFDLDRLKRVIPGFVAMNPMTALLFIFAGSALALSLQQKRSNFFRPTAKVLSAALTGVALIKFLGIGLHWLPNIDEILFASKLSDIRDQLPNRMAPNTALNFVFIGLSLLALDRPVKQFCTSQGWAIIAAFGGLLPLTGYAYGVQSFSGMASFIPMAVHTALTFLLLAAGLFFARADAPLAEVFAGNDPRGVMARRLFPLAVLVTLFLGWLRVHGERLHLYESEFGTALFAITLSILFIILVRWTVGTVSALESQRAAVTARLHDLNRRKDEMIAVVSHDLCSPLTGFRMVTDLLRENPEQPSDELLDLMDHSARRMVSMVRGLLDVSKIGADQMELECEDVLVSDVVSQSIEPLTINANAKHIALELHVGEGEPLIYADRLRLSQIFNNLLSNAVKFTLPGGSVSVDVSQSSDGVRVLVKDTGLGISDTDILHVFDKYYQASTKSTAGEKGVGLGLAIVRELVLLHEGRIDVASELNRGTTFTVNLPQRMQERKAAVTPREVTKPLSQLATA